MSSDDYDEGLNEAVVEITDEDEYTPIEEKSNEKIILDEATDDTFDFKKLTDEEQFERAKQKLRDAQKNTYEKEDQKYVEIDIPATGKIGEDFIIYTNKKVPIIEYAVCQQLDWKKKNKYNRGSKKELVGKSFMIGTRKDTDSCTFKWIDMYSFQGKQINGLKAGEYLVEVSARSTEAYEETKAIRLVRVE